MRFSVIRRLRDAEKLLDEELARASADLAGKDAKPRHLITALIRARDTNHPRWRQFIQFARIVVEARDHISAERQQLEHEVSLALTASIRKLRRKG